MQYNTIQYNTTQYNTILYNTIQYNTIQYNTIQFNTIQYNTIHRLKQLIPGLEMAIDYYMEEGCIIFQNTIQHYTILYTIQFNSITTKFNIMQ